MSDDAARAVVEEAGGGPEVIGPPDLVQLAFTLGDLCSEIRELRIEIGNLQRGMADLTDALLGIEIKRPAND